MNSLTRALALCAIALLAACATPADPTRMVVASGPGAAAFPARLQSATCVRNVTGGEETNPLWISKVGNGEFRDALTASLRNNTLLADTSGCRFPIDANLLGLAQPAAGFDLEVVSHINYKMYDTSGKAILLETISAPYTANFSEAAFAVIRLQRANEGAIRASITKFLDKLRGLPPG